MKLPYSNVFLAVSISERFASTFVVYSFSFCALVIIVKVYSFMIISDTPIT